MREGESRGVRDREGNQTGRGMSETPHDDGDHEAGINSWKRKREKPTGD